MEIDIKIYVVEHFPRSPVARLLPHGGTGVQGKQRTELLPRVFLVGQEMF